MSQDQVALTKQARSEVFDTAPIVWMNLENDERDVKLSNLSEWLDWLIDRYDLDYRWIPECWQEHGSLIEELSSLQVAWSTAHCISPRSNTYSTLHWHVDFAAARNRLAEWISRSGCRPGAHRSATQRARRSTA